MESKSIGLIAIVTVVIVAAAGISWYASEDHDDAYREIGVGDSFLYKVTVTDEDYPGVESSYYQYEYVYKSDPDGLMLMSGVSGWDYEPYSPYRYFSEMEPQRMETIGFMGEEVECRVYEGYFGPGAEDVYWVDPRTGAIVHAESDGGGMRYVMELVKSTLYGGLDMDVAVNSQKTEVEAGDVVSYLITQYDGATQTGIGMITHAVTSVDGDMLTYTVAGTGESMTDTVANFLNTDGYRGLEPMGTGYVKNTEYGNILCDLYLEEDADGGYQEVYVGKDDGVVYLRCEYEGDLRIEYSLAYSSLVVGSAPFELMPMDDPFGYNATGVRYTMDGAVPTYSVEEDYLIAYQSADGTYTTSLYENLEPAGQEPGIPDFIALQDVTWEAAEGRTINTPWGALECEGMAGELDGLLVTAYRYGGVVIALDVQDGEDRSFIVYTHYGYDWGRDDPIQKSELRTDIVVNDYCRYVENDWSDIVTLRVTATDGDGNITVMQDGVESSWTVEGLLKGPGYTNGEYVGKFVGDFLYGTRNCEVYRSIEDDGTVFTSYIGIDDGILYALGEERDGEETLLELYWASYVA